MQAMTRSRISRWEQCPMPMRKSQYLHPDRGHLPVERLIEPARFVVFRRTCEEPGFANVASGPLVHSPLPRWPPSDRHRLIASRSLVLARKNRRARWESSLNGYDRQFQG